MKRSKKTSLSKIALLEQQYIAELTSALNSSDKGSPYLSFVDRSFLTGNYMDILTGDLLEWHIVVARFNESFWRATGRRLFRRLLPVLRGSYSPQEAKLIKYALHFQLTWGIEVWVIFTSDSDFLQNTFGSDNLGVIKGRKLIDSPRLYDPGAPAELRIVTRSTGLLSDTHASFAALRDHEAVHVLRYTHRSFSSYELKSLKKDWGGFLFELQGGRCGLTGAALTEPSWDVDHIFPRGYGGNNTLINCQATLRKANIHKGAGLEVLRYCLQPSEIASYGLDLDFHRKLSDRTLKGIQPGWRAPFSLNWRSL